VRNERDIRGLCGRRVGPYLVEDVIGVGAMGAVYAAVDLNLKREVALKVIHAALAEDRRYTERFLREARAAARLNHPNIVQIYAAGTTGGVTHLALELVRGGSLRQIMRRAGGRLPALPACEIVRDGALALGAAHAQGIVHRDVKPDNFLVVMDEALAAGPGAPAARACGLHVKLSDFGIARLNAPSARLTQSGLFVGTPGYSSPEQCEGKEVDARSDLYSLGVVLYELVTGRLPHQAPTQLALFARIVSEAPIPVREANPELGEELAAFVHRLLEKEPEERFPDADAVVRALDLLAPALPYVPLVLGSPPTIDLPAPSAAARVGSDPDAATETGEGTSGFAPSDADPEPIPASLPPLPPLPPPAAEPVLARIAMIDRLAEGGHPAPALRAAALVARELLADSQLRLHVLRPLREDSSAASGSGIGRAESGRKSTGGLGPPPADPLGRALVRVRDALADPGVPLRPLPSLIEAIGPLRRLEGGPAEAAAAIEAAITERRAAPPSAPYRPIHPLAVVHLAALGVGLALPWKWDELPGAYDDAVVSLDPEGRQQVQAAAAALAALLGPEEGARVRAFNAGRRIVPVVSLGNVGAIEGPSAGLPTFLAMVAAFFGLTPRRGFAASGTIDAASVPSLPQDERAAALACERALGARVERVEAVMAKLEAVLEGRPDVDLVLLPAANRAEVEADATLLEDARASGVELRFVATIGEALAADLFEERLVTGPLRLAARSDERRLAAEVRAAVRLAWAALAAAAAFAGVAAFAGFGGVRRP
jgi:serine/threonine protein kinase